MTLLSEAYYECALLLYQSYLVESIVKGSDLERDNAVEDLLRSQLDRMSKKLSDDETDKIAKLSHALYLLLEAKLL